MTCYYAVPVKRENRTLSYNPLDGHCAIAPTPHDALVGLGMPETGSLFAIWPLTRKVGIGEAGRICSYMAPLRIFIVVDDQEGVIFPLSIDLIPNLIAEVPDAVAD